MKIYKNRKRIICVALCCVTLVTSMYYAYDNPKEVKAIAVVDDIAIVLAILAACGVGYVGYEWFNQSDIAGYADDVAKAEESLSRLWDNAVTQFGGDYNPDDFDPDNDDPNEKPPKWEKLKIWAKTHPGATLALGAGGALGAVVTAVTPQILKAREEGALNPDNFKLSDLDSDLSQEMKDNLKDYPYYVVYTKGTLKNTYIYMYAQKPYVYKNGDSIVFNPQISGMEYGIYTGLSGRWSYYGSTTGMAFNPLDYKYWYTNLYIYDDESDARTNTDVDNKGMIYPGTINPASLPLSTDIMDWLNENPGKDAPDKPLYDNVKIPTQDEVDTFIQDLDKSRDDEDTEDEQQRQTITNNFIQNITNVTPDPDPEPTPDPDPEPTPDPEPGGDNPNLEPSQLEFDFKLLFPFCIPFDLIDALEVLDAEPVAPAIDVPIPYMTEKGMKMHTIKIDLSEYDSIALLLRRMELLLFIVGLILLTRNIIRG